MTFPEIVLTFATYNSIDRANALFESLRKTVHRENAKIIVVNTGKFIEDIFLGAMTVNATFVQVENKKRPYLYVMEEKIKASMGYIGPETIFMGIDDDYIVNPYIFDWVRHIFKEPSVMFSSIIRTPFDDVNNEKIVVNGFDMVMVDSTMGGGFAARGKEFFKYALQYSNQKDVDSMWDQGFWRYVAEKIGRKDFIYMIRDMSLADHTNYGSNYMEIKSGFDDFMPCCNFIESNPFDLMKTKIKI